MTIPTHSELVQVAAKWLGSKYPVVVTELTTVTNEQPDAIGFQAWGKTALIECKASHLDFKSDAKKIFRMHPYLGMGSLRWYLCPTDVIQPEELPQGWGLLYFNGKRVVQIVKPVHFDARNHIAENMILLSTIRRISVPEMKGVSIKVYTTETKCRASLFVNQNLNQENSSMKKSLSKKSQRVNMVVGRMLAMAKENDCYASDFAELLANRVDPSDEKRIDTYIGMLENDLNTIKNDDGFGSEASTDPRGDFREGNWSMNHVQGVDA